MDDTDTKIMTDDEIREAVDRAAREAEANQEFLGNAWEVGYGGGVMGRDEDEDVRVIETELGRQLEPDELLQYRRGFREGRVDRVRHQEDLADAGPPDWTGVPL